MQSDNTVKSFAGLENLSSTQLDLSIVTDSMPSLSIDETNGGEDSNLKDLYDKIDRLRRENFDLKLKLYLYENDGKDNIDSDNRRIIRELDKKNNEIYLLRDTLDGKAGKLREVKRKLTTAEHDKHNLEERNEQLQTKLAEAIEICASLIEHTPKFTTTAAAKRDQDVLSVSGKLIDKAKHFLVEISNTSFDAKDFNQNDDRAKPIDVRAIDDAIRVANRGDDATPPGYAMIEPFRKSIHTLQQLIGQFTSNKIDYTTFLSTLDTVYNTLNEQIESLEKYQHDNKLLDDKLQQAQRELLQMHQLDALVRAELNKRVDRMDLLVNKFQECLPPPAST